MCRRLAALVLLGLCVAPAAVAQPAGSDPRSPRERLSLFVQTRNAVRDRHEAQRRAIAADTTRTAEARQAAQDANRRAEQEELLTVHRVQGFHLAEFIYYALPPATLTDSFKDFLRQASRTRVDQQLGSTSQIVKTGVAALFGFALETGAVTQTINQNVATVHANADGLVRFLANQDLFPVCDPTAADCDTGSPLKNLELSASFDVSDADAQSLSGTTPGTGSAINFSTMVTQHQFASATARYALDRFNHRDLRSAAYLRKWLDWLSKNKDQMVPAATDLLSSTQPVEDALEKARATAPSALADCNDSMLLYDRWLCESNAALAGATDAEWPDVLQKRLDVLLAGMRAADPTFDQKLADAGRAFLRYMSLRRSLAATVITDPSLTVDYTYSEPAVQPRMHSVVIAWAFSPKGAAGTANTGTITVNAGVDFYHDPQPTGVNLNTSRWKDARAVVTFDRPMGPADSAATLSATVYYQYQRFPNPFVVPSGAVTLPGTNIPLPAAGTKLLSDTGSIVVAQGVVTIRFASNGLKIPIGISWANRSELVSGNRVIGTVGFSFDSAPLLLLQGNR